MYISISSMTLGGDSEGDLVSKSETAYASRRNADGFRWSMLLRAQDDANSFTSVSMWLTPEAEQAWRETNDAPAPTHGYDVVTARGSMTPASAVALVDWQIDAALAGRFSAGWNAAYHAIEDAFGSRLLQDLTSPETYVGLHVVTDPAKLDPQVLGAELTDPEGLSLAPLAVQRFDVVLLTEAP
jgi:heme-degrading monooxygenase HmoA